MSAADYFFILSAIYLAHETTPSWRTWLGFLFIVMGTIAALTAK